MTKTLILTLPDFKKILEIDCKASNLGIRAVLSQEGHPITSFNAKFRDERKNYSLYDEEFYATIETLHFLRQYLVSNKFVLYSNEALQFLDGQV